MNQEAETILEERIFAAVSHGAAFMLGGGIVIPLVIWIIQREKSKFVKFHALQAMAFQLTFSLFSMLMTIGLMIVFFVITITTVDFASETDANGMSGLFIGQLVFMGGFLFFLAVYPVVGFIAGALTLAGRDIRYPILGSRLYEYLSRDIETEFSQGVENE